MGHPWSKLHPQSGLMEYAIVEQGWEEEYAVCWQETQDELLGAVQAAEQLGRADDIIAWGQDGSFITGPNVNPHLAGSVFYFLEGYAVYALKDVVDQIAAGKAPAVKDDAGDPASRVKPCPISAAAAQKIPDMAERVKQLLAAPAGTTEYDLFCPKA